MLQNSLRLLIRLFAIGVLAVSAIVALADRAFAVSGTSISPLKLSAGRYLLADQENFQTRLMAELTVNGALRLEGIIEGQRLECRGQVRNDLPRGRLGAHLLCNRTAQATIDWDLKNTSPELLARGLVTSLHLTFRQRRAGDSQLQTHYNRPVDFSRLDVASY